MRLSIRPDSFIRLKRLLHFSSVSTKPCNSFFFGCDFLFVCLDLDFFCCCFCLIFLVLVWFGLIWFDLVWLGLGFFLRQFQIVSPALLSLICQEASMGFSGWTRESCYHTPLTSNKDCSWSQNDIFVPVLHLVTDKHNRNRCNGLMLLDFFIHRCVWQIKCLWSFADFLYTLALSWNTVAETELVLQQKTLLVHVCELQHICCLAVFTLGSAGLSIKAWINADFGWFESLTLF